MYMCVVWCGVCGGCGCVCVCVWCGVVWCVWWVWVCVHAKIDRVKLRKYFAGLNLKYSL